jgi:hypothetical protein
MEASAREVVELASSDYELSDVSDRSTDVPVPPSLPPLDLDTTQVVPKLVLSELRYQARLRSNPGHPALAANDAAAVAAEPPAPVASAPAASAPAATVETIETTEPTRGYGRAVAAGVALGLVAVALVSGVFALVY